MGMMARHFSASYERVTARDYLSASRYTSTATPVAVARAAAMPGATPSAAGAASATRRLDRDAPSSAGAVIIANVSCPTQRTPSVGAPRQTKTAVKARPARLSKQLSCRATGRDATTMYTFNKQVFYALVINNASARRALHSRIRGTRRDVGNPDCGICARAVQGQSLPVAAWDPTRLLPRQVRTVPRGAGVRAYARRRPREGAGFGATARGA